VVKQGVAGTAAARPAAGVRDVGAVAAGCCAGAGSVATTAVAG